MRLGRLPYGTQSRPDKFVKFSHRVDTLTLKFCKLQPLIPNEWLNGTECWKYTSVGFGGLCMVSVRVNDFTLSSVMLPPRLTFFFHTSVRDVTDRKPTQVPCNNVSWMSFVSLRKYTGISHDSKTGPYLKYNFCSRVWGLSSPVSDVLFSLHHPRTTRLVSVVSHHLTSGDALKEELVENPLNVRNSLSVGILPSVLRRLSSKGVNWFRITVVHTTVSMCVFIVIQNVVWSSLVGYEA